MSKMAVILAGGRGARLGEYTKNRPKSLLPIGSDPILEILISQLAKAGFTRIVLALHYLADQILSFCKDGSQWGVEIEYVHEEQPLGTIGPIKQISSLAEHLLILNSDILTDFEFGTFYDLHLESKAMLSIAYYQHQEECSYGILEIEDKRVVGFKEKPVFEHPINMGVYMANRMILDYIPEGQPYSFDQLIIHLLQSDQHIAAVGHRGRWIDIGSIKNYEKANEDLVCTFL